jgi:hypothetical protein
VDQSWTNPWTNSVDQSPWTTAAAIDELDAGPRTPWTEILSWTMRRSAEGSVFLNNPFVNVPAAERQSSC